MNSEFCWICSKPLTDETIRQSIVMFGDYPNGTFFTSLEPHCEGCKRLNERINQIEDNHANGC